jgi:Ca-activated chloride channel family protein
MRALLGLMAVALVSVAHAQTATRVRIVSPKDSDYVSGETVVRVALENADSRLTSVAVSADGAAVCTITREPLECTFNAGPELRRRVIRAVATFASGTRAVHSVSTADVGVAESTGVEAVLVAVSVRDGRGRFVPGLRQEHFRLFERDKPQPISFFAPEGWPCEIVLAIDVSGSMEKSLPGVRQAAKAFVSALRPDDHVTIAAFNHSFFLLAPRNATPEARLRALDRIAPFGGTAVFDALLASTEQLEGRSGRRAIVMFTDGLDQSSEVLPQRVEERLLSEDVLLYIVGYGNTSGMREAFNRIARATGGEAVFLDGVEEATVAFRRIIDELTQQYTVGFTPSLEGPPGWRPVRVEVTGGNYRVRARQGYVPQTANTR